MTLNEVRQTFLDFFKSKRHAIIPSHSLIPEDKTVLFTTAGMQPLVPYLMGEKPHPKGARLANAQKCLRTDDILEVGDNRHLTFFEMLGNWSVGDYFKKEAIEWSFELLTSKERGRFGIDPHKLYVTVFEDKNMGIPRDDESIGHWTRVFISAGIQAHLGERIFTYPKKKNWWELPGEGPCGPDTEMFYDTGKPHNPAFGEKCHPNCECGRFVEIWNDVFMEYEKKKDGKGGFIYTPLKQKNVDTGMGLERITMVLQEKEMVFDIDAFSIPFQGLPLKEAGGRIIADHLRAAIFLISDGVLPSNIERGYILRSLLSRAFTRARGLKLKDDFYHILINLACAYYKDAYRLLPPTDIIEVISIELEKFRPRIEKGIEEFNEAQKKYSATGTIPGYVVFGSHGSTGARLDLWEDLAKEADIKIDKKGFWEEYKKHQEVSRAGQEKKFGGHGLILQTGELKAADEAELKKVTRLHTATHLLQAALRKVLGEHVHQMGSDITAERLRFDFSHPQKLTDEEKKKVEDLVNEQVGRGLPMAFEEMSIDDAEKSGALMFQKEKYGKTVKVYSAGDFSKELCGGPHVQNTKQVGKFKILKEEASSAGVRRIRAIVEK